MQYPKINTCILCDDFRVERGNKSSIMGLYGILPTEILVLDEKVPIPRLSFILMAEGGEGDFQIHATIGRPAGKSTFEFKPPNFAYKGIAKKGIVAFTIVGFIPEAIGDFRFRVFANDQKIYDSIMTIRIGEQKDFL